MFASALLLAAVAVVAALPNPFFNDQYPINHVEKLFYPPQQSTELGTIFQVLSQDSEFSRIVKAIKFSGIDSLLDDSSAGLTFFAPPDSALHRPRKHPRHDVGDLAVLTKSQQYDLSHVISMLEESEHPSDDNDDDDKEKRKEMLKRLLRAILAYHVIPRNLDSVALGENTTYPSTLTIPGAVGGEPQRLRVQQNPLPPATTINFYSKVIRANTRASNGVIHVVNHPLLPPPSVFQELFMAPSVFSTFTSTLQRAALTDFLDLRFIPGEDGKLEGANTVTVFAPSNRAFQALPKKLQLFLFSTYGGSALQKLLQYHIVPNLSLHSDYLYNGTKHGENGGKLCACGDAYLERDWKDHHSGHSGKPIINHKLTVPTLLANHSLHVRVTKYNVTIPFPGPHKPPTIATRISVNGQPIIIADIPGRNGAIHTIGQLIDPRGRHHHNKEDNAEEADSWEDWEEWLPQWALQN